MREKLPLRRCAKAAFLFMFFPFVCAKYLERFVCELLAKPYEQLLHPLDDPDVAKLRDGFWDKVFSQCGRPAQVATLKFKSPELFIHIKNYLK